MTDEEQSVKVTLEFYSDKAEDLVRKSFFKEFDEARVSDELLIKDAVTEVLDKSHREVDTDRWTLLFHPDEIIVQLAPGEVPRKIPEERVESVFEDITGIENVGSCMIDYDRGQITANILEE